MSEIGYVSFTIDGTWLTDFVRKRFIHEDMDFDWVTETLGELLKTNNLTSERVEQIAQDIILGRSYFTGRSAGGHLTYCDCSDEPIKSDFFREYDRLKKELKQAQEERKEFFDAWQELMMVTTGELDKRSCLNQYNINLFRPTPLEEFIDRLTAPEEEVAPYGYIAPDGTFYKVDWCDHEEFAWKIIRERYSEEEACDEFTGKDFIILSKGWLLLHNPSQGTPFLTSGDKPMTKAQREALFDYYTKYGMLKEASALYKEDPYNG